MFFTIVYEKALSGIDYRMQMLVSYKDLTNYKGTIETAAEFRDFIYDKKTKTIFAFLGEHTIGTNRITGIDITGQTFKFIKIDRNATKTFAGLPIAWTNFTETVVDVKGSGDAVLEDLSTDEQAADRFF